jgi:hypothetical protein
MTKWLGTDVIRIERKELPLNEKFEYNPSFRVDYHQRMCFDIDCEPSYLLFERIRCLALSYEIDYATPKGVFGEDSCLEDSLPSRITKNEYNKTITYGEVDITEILDFIANEEWQILNDRANNLNVLAANDMRCPDCQRKLYFK